MDEIEQKIKTELISLRLKGYQEDILELFPYHRKSLNWVLDQNKLEYLLTDAIPDKKGKRKVYLNICSREMDMHGKDLIAALVKERVHASGIKIGDSENENTSHTKRK